MARVFISFVHEDEKVASAMQSLIASELKLGDEVFLSSDRRQIYGGDIWLDKIRSALEGCEVLVLMVSKRALHRPWMNFEAGAVWLNRRPVVPLCFGNVSKHKLPQPYAGMQALDLPMDAGYAIESVHHHLKLTIPKPESPYMTALRQLGEPPVGRGADPMAAYNRLDTTLQSFKDDD